MPRYMLDTDTSSYIMMRSNDSLLRQLKEILVSDVCISVITKAQLLFGVEIWPRRQPDEAVLGAFLAYVAVVDLPDHASPRTGRWGLQQLLASDVLFSARTQIRLGHLSRSDGAFRAGMPLPRSEPHTTPALLH
jgi:predicted nucleic acid-binding protein